MTSCSNREYFDFVCNLRALDVNLGTVKVSIDNSEVSEAILIDHLGKGTCIKR